MILTHLEQICSFFLAASNECKRPERSDTWLTARSVLLGFFRGGKKKLSEIQGNGDIPPSLLLLKMHFMLENSAWKWHKIHGRGDGAKQGTGGWARTWDAANQARWYSHGIFCPGPNLQLDLHSYLWIEQGLHAKVLLISLSHSGAA